MCENVKTVFALYNLLSSNLHRIRLLYIVLYTHMHLFLSFSDMVYRRQYSNESVISNPAIICFITCAVPFILVYGDMGSRYMYSPISKGFQYTLQTTINVTFEKTGMMFNVTHVSVQIYPVLQNAVECFEIYFHEELSVFFSVLKFKQNSTTYSYKWLI